MARSRGRGLACALVIAQAIACVTVADSDTTEDALSFGGVTVRGYDATLPDFDAIGYDIDLRIEEVRSGEESFRASVEGTYVATRDIASIDLDLEGNEVEAALVNGRAATFRRTGGSLRIDLGATVAKGKSFSTTVRYKGAVFQADGKDPEDFAGFGGLMVAHRGRAQGTIFASLNWPRKARRWLPLRDHPSDGAMVTMRATFPKRLEAVANGKRISVRENQDATRTWQYSALTPMPPYDIFVAAYDGWQEKTYRAPESGTEIRSFVYTRDANASDAIFADVPAVADFYARTFGAYKFGEHISFLEVPMYGGGMENASVVGMAESLFPRAANAEARVVAFHELAHHWSGNLVRIGTWNDFWLSEGFTEYLTRRGVLERDGADAAKALWRETLRTALVAELESSHPVRPADPEKDVLAFFDDVVYEKGSIVLRMLEQRFGVERFTAFLRAWFEKHAFGHVTTADLERELSEAMGVDLSSYFKQWVYGEYHPELRVTYARVDDRRIDVKVEQLQTKGPARGFDMPVEIELALGAEKRRVEIKLTGRTTTMRADVAFDPTTITVDPEERVYVMATCDTGARCRDGYRCASTHSPPVCVPQALP